MKQYYIAKGNFGNQYQLRYTESADQAATAEKAGWERITRKAAIAYCVQENDRRKYDQNCSGYADNLILPYGYDDYDSSDEKLIESTYGYAAHNPVRAYRDGYLVVRA